MNIDISEEFEYLAGLEGFTSGEWKWYKDEGVWYLHPGIMIVDWFTDGTPAGDEHDQKNAELIKNAPILWTKYAFALCEISRLRNEIKKLS